MHNSTLAAILSVALAGGAWAQAPADSEGLKTGTGGEVNALFGELDINHDGRVSRDEAKGSTELTASWAKLDANKDSYLTAQEYSKWKPPVPGAPHTGTGEKTPAR
jgi:hypothetical protein